MEIVKIEIVNFKGIKHLDLNMPHIMALIGKNGVGKTTFLEALRFGLTGVEPVGDLINAGADKAWVAITLLDHVSNRPVQFTRERNRDKPSKFKIDGKATTQTALNNHLQAVCGVPLDKVNILSSSEVVAALKPQEFAAFILNYIPEKKSKEEIIEILKDCSPEMLDILDYVMPENDISLQVLDEIADELRSKRKDLKAALASQKVLLSECPEEKPGDRKEVEEKLEDFKKAAALKSTFEIATKSYNNACAEIAKLTKQEEELKAEIAKIDATRPDEMIRKNLEAERERIGESLNNQILAIRSAENATATLQSTLDALSTDICPISSLIKCSQDKSAARAEITESLNSSSEGIKALKIEVEKLNARLDAVGKKIMEYDENRRNYDRKILMNKQLLQIQGLINDRKATLPAKPELPAGAQLDEIQAKQLQNTLSYIEKYEKGLELRKIVDSMEEQLNAYEALVKAFAEKGIVRTTIIDSYLSVFENICNERSKQFRPNNDFMFVSNDGVVCLMNNGNNVYLPYESLSGGEKAYMLFIIMDVLNQLCAANLLLLDELSVVDNVCLEALCGIVLQHSADYNHIVLAAVDHEDTLNLIKTKGIPIINGFINQFSEG